jgi:hypothetical protein
MKVTAPVGDAAIAARDDCRKSDGLSSERRCGAGRERGESRCLLNRISEALRRCAAGIISMTLICRRDGMIVGRQGRVDVSSLPKEV